MKTIYYNGSIYTGKLPLVQAFVVENGKFIYVGDTENAKSMADTDDVFVDLEGKFVCSGFNDSHMHVLGFGKFLQEGNLAEHTQSLEEMLDYLKGFAKETEGSSLWIWGRGWNQDYFRDVDRMPSRYDLDKISAERPVCVVRACGHCLVVNSKALELLGITEETVAPEGGEIGKENGVLDGRLYDNAMVPVFEAVPVPDKAAVKNMILMACRRLNTYGITSCQSDDYSSFCNLSWEVIQEAYKELEESGELTVRVYEQSNFETLEDLQYFVENGNVTGKGTEMFKTGPLKMLGDGALGARTAFLTNPYADDPSTKGIPVFSKEVLEDMICYANKVGMQVAVHAIGDGCLDWVLEAYEKANKEHPRSDHRHGIVHCQITRPEQLQKIKELNLHVYAQTIFLDYDSVIVEARVGKELASTSYSWKTLMKDGVSVSNGSDCPVELPDVMAGMQCGVTRRPLGKPKETEAYLPEEAFTIQEILDSYTIRGAEASFEENIKGKIETGMLADFVVLEENPFETDENRLKDISICATYLGGKEVYRR